MDQGWLTESVRDPTSGVRDSISGGSLVCDNLYP